MTEKLGGGKLIGNGPAVDSQIRLVLPMAPGMYLGCNVLLPGAGSPTEQNGDVGTGNHLYQTVHLMGFGAFTSVELLFVIVFIQYLRYQSQEIVWLHRLTQVVDEFFGHQKGAFTGAESDKVGLFRAVNGGTLFLDEIGNLSYKTQMLLLRALQEKRCKPVGSTKEYSFDIRLVAATNENLEKAIGEGRFREDLFHRLNEFTLRIPTLAECREDILPLAYFFLKLTCAKAHKSFRGFDRLAEAALLEYPWPGNIRELKNVIGRAVLICQEQWISVSDLNLEISLPKEEETQWTEEEKEKALLLQTLEKTGDNRSNKFHIETGVNKKCKPSLTRMLGRLTLL